MNGIVSAEFLSLSPRTSRVSIAVQQKSKPPMMRGQRFKERTVAPAGGKNGERAPPSTAVMPSSGFLEYLNTKSSSAKLTWILPQEEFRTSFLFLTVLCLLCKLRPLLGHSESLSLRLGHNRPQLG